MIAAAAGLGYDLTGHRGQMLTPELIEWADDLVAVDQETAKAVEAVAGPERPVRLLAAEGITDPWGGPPEGFTSAMEQIEKATEFYTV